MASHSDFMSLHARDIQRILRDRLILVHDNPIDYNYRWDLESFGRVHDVDMKTSVQGETCFFLVKYITKTRISFNKYKSS